MKRHGFKGAGDLSRVVDIAFGWDATAVVLEDWMYKELANKYALDKTMQDWLKEVNTYALQNIAERLLEAIKRDMWQATEEMNQNCVIFTWTSKECWKKAKQGTQRHRNHVQ